MVSDRLRGVTVVTLCVSRVPPGYVCNRTRELRHGVATVRRHASPCRTKRHDGLRIHADVCAAV